MNCQELTQLIDDYIENELDAGLENSARQHLKGCVNCQHRVDNRLQLKESLAEFPVPEMRSGFANQAIERAIQANKTIGSLTSKPKFRWAFSAGFATALATTFAIWFLVNTFTLTREDFHAKSIQALNIELHESKTVKIVFNSPQAMRNATVTLELPKQIELNGYSNKRSLTWSTQIKAGKNVLSLPVRALDIGHGELITKVEFGGKSKMIKFNVNVNQIHQSKPIDNIKLPRADIGVSA